MGLVLKQGQYELKDITAIDADGLYVVPTDYLKKCAAASSGTGSPFTPYEATEIRRELEVRDRVERVIEARGLVTSELDKVDSISGDPLVEPTVEPVIPPQVPAGTPINPVTGQPIHETSPDTEIVSPAEAEASTRSGSPSPARSPRK